MRRVVGLVVLSVLVAPAAIAVFGTATPAGAAPPFTTFPQTTTPGGVAGGSDGRVWFTETATDKIARINTDGTGLTEFPLSAGAAPKRVISGPDGRLWFNEPGLHKVGRIATDGTGYTEFNVWTNDLTSGPDGNVWIAEANAAKVGRLTATGVLTEFPTTCCAPGSITANPDGGLWFTDGTSGLHRISTTGTVTAVSLPPQLSAPQQIASTPDGNLWFTFSASASQPYSNIARATTAGVTTTFDIPIPFDFGLTSGPDGALWTVGQVAPPSTGAAVALVRVDPQSGQPTYLYTWREPNPPTWLLGLSSGPAADNSIWFIEGQPDALVRVPLVRKVTSVTVSSSANPGYPGDYDLLATVTPGGTGTPTGPVTFLDSHGTAFGSAQLVNGVATLHNPSLPLGSNFVHADYAGDANFSGNTSGEFGQAVSFIPTTTTLTVSPSGYSRAGDPVTLTAHVSVASGLTAPTGNVRFFHDFVEIGSAPLVGSTASLPTSALPQGLDGLFASYGGSATHSASTSTTVEQYVDFNAQLDRYVESVYIDLLGRLPDDAGRVYWTGLLSHGVSRAATSWALVTSDEYRADVIAGMYEQFLERDTDAGGLNYWVGQVGRGMTFENFQSLLMGSDEYFAMASKGNGDNDTFVKAMYKDVLGRDVDPGGEAYFVSLLQQGTPRSQVVGGIVYSYEHLSTTVDGYYEDLLGRPSDPGGNAYWANQLQHGARDEVIVALIIGSDEYYSLVA